MPSPFGVIAFGTKIRGVHLSVISIVSDLLQPSKFVTVNMYEPAFATVNLFKQYYCEDCYLLPNLNFQFPQNKPPDLEYA